jgi:MFS family permease
MAATGTVAIPIFNRIVPAEEPQSRSTTRVPWGEMLRFPPFQKLLASIVAWSVAYGGMTAFTVVFLKTPLQLGEGTILLLNSAMFLGGLSSLWLLGSRLDHLGSKPVAIFSLAVWLAVTLGWMAIAGRLLASSLALILAFHFLMGLCAALIAMANVRLAMAIVPKMGRNHFFALYSVVGSVALGAAPIAWGLGIDAIGANHFRALRLDWNRFSLFFAAIAVVLIAALALARRLEEPKAASMEELLRELLVQAPRRVWVRFWPSK